MKNPKDKTQKVNITRAENASLKKIKAQTNIFSYYNKSHTQKKDESLMIVPHEKLS